MLRNLVTKIVEARQATCQAAGELGSSAGLLFDAFEDFSDALQETDSVISGIKIHASGISDTRSSAEYCDILIPVLNKLGNALRPIINLTRKLPVYNGESLKALLEFERTIKRWTRLLELAQIALNHPPPAPNPRSINISGHLYNLFESLTTCVDGVVSWVGRFERLEVARIKVYKREVREFLAIVSAISAVFLTVSGGFLILSYTIPPIKTPRNVFWILSVALCTAASVSSLVALGWERLTFNKPFALHGIVRLAANFLPKFLLSSALITFMAGVILFVLDTQTVELAIIIAVIFITPTTGVVTALLLWVWEWQPRMDMSRFHRLLPLLLRVIPRMPTLPVFIVRHATGDGSAVANAHLEDIHTWNVRTRQIDPSNLEKLRTWSVPPDIRSDGLTQMEVSCDGSCVALVFDKSCVLVDVKTGQHRNLSTSQDTVTSVHWLPRNQSRLPTEESRSHTEESKSNTLLTFDAKGFTIWRVNETPFMLCKEIWTAAPIKQITLLLGVKSILVILMDKELVVKSLSGTAEFRPNRNKWSIGGELERLTPESLELDFCDSEVAGFIFDHVSVLLDAAKELIYLCVVNERYKADFLCSHLVAFRPSTDLKVVSHQILPDQLVRVITNENHEYLIFEYLNPETKPPELWKWHNDDLNMCVRFTDSTMRPSSLSFLGPYVVGLKEEDYTLEFMAIDSITGGSRNLPQSRPQGSSSTRGWVSRPA